MKQSKIILSSLLVSSILLASGGVALAADTSATTDGIVQFKDASGEKNPVDPTEEDPKPVDPEIPVGTDGLLRLDQVPTLNFGTVEIKGQEVKAPVQYVKLNKTDGSLLYYVPAYLQVTDERGTNAGWSVSAQLDSFKAVDKTTNQVVSGVEPLKGATVSFKNGQVKNHSGLTATEVASSQPTAYDVIDLEANDTVGAQKILGATAEKGMGTWTNSYYTNDGSLLAPPTAQTVETDNSIELSIPGTAKKSKEYNYVSTITWTVSDTPDNL